MLNNARNAFTHNIQPLNAGKIPRVQPSIIIMTSFLVMDGNVSEVVVSSCAEGRAGSISHTDSSVEGDNMTRLRGTRAKNRVLAP